MLSFYSPQDYSETINHYKVDRHRHVPPIMRGGVPHSEGQSGNGCQIPIGPADAQPNQMGKTEICVSVARNKFADANQINHPKKFQCTLRFRTVTKFDSGDSVTVNKNSNS